MLLLQRFDHLEKAEANSNIENRSSKLLHLKTMHIIGLNAPKTTKIKLGKHYVHKENKECNTL